MTIQLDQKTKDRTSKAIQNIRLIASRVKRANVQDAMQRCEIVVTCLNNLRSFLNRNEGLLEANDFNGAFQHNTYTLERVVEAAQQADIIYLMLTREKRTSYREERKQVSNLFADVRDYLTSKTSEGD